MYEEKKKENVLFDNIIWVSAKKDYYDYIHDTIEIQSPQIIELRNILLAILRFFEIENPDEYNTEDLKALVLMVFEEHKVLLILDNFETIENKDQIIDFFGTRVKTHLRKHPQNFKIILTSRELVPSGFRQVELNGLDLAEAKKLMGSLYRRYKSAVELTDDQKRVLHETVKGVPILLKHSFARIYEYNESFDSVITNLPSFSSRLVQFSFKEILDRIRREKDQVSLQILILLEIISRPLMKRQMANILEIDENKLEQHLPNLSNFECVRRRMIDNQEKYYLNDEIKLLTQSLVRDNRQLYTNVRKKYFKNFTIAKQMDYSSEEEELILIFEDYIRAHQFSEALNFMKEQLRKKPDSIVLNYYYAKYLKDSKIDIPNSIRILEKLIEQSGKHPSILKLLFTCYASLEIPNFEKADQLVSQISHDLGDEMDVETIIEIASFYVRWSAYLRQKTSIDQFEDNQRIFKYQERAKKVIDLLSPLEKISNDPVWKKKTEKLDKVELYYLLSQGYYNLWEYSTAIKMIDKAIEIAGQGHSSLMTYENLRDKIKATKNFYSKNPWAGRTNNK